MPGATVPLRERRRVAAAAEGGHRTLAEKACDALKGAIIEGEIRAGERLQIEAVAARVGMSPVPVREALRLLDDAGLVEQVPHRGARVRELSIADLKEVYEARLSLETITIRTAAARFTEADELAATQALARHLRLAEGGPSTEAYHAHIGFHFTLYRAAGSRWLVRLLTPLWDSSVRYRLALPPRRRRAAEERPAEHERILRACIEHEPDRAAAELHNHVARTANLCARYMGAGADLFPLRPVPRRRKRAAAAATGTEVR